MTKEHLIHLLELGHVVEYNKEFDLTVYDEVGNYFVSKYGKSFNIDFSDNNNTFKIVTPAPKLLPVGTKVVVLENCPEKELQGKEFVIFRVHKVQTCFYVLKDKENEYDMFNIPHWAVAPIEVTEPHKYQEVIDLIEGITMETSSIVLKEILLERIKNLK